jgi:mRNA interferase RelE/StbE
VNAALQIWTDTFCKDFDRLHPRIQQAIQDKIDELGTRLDSFPHHRLKGRNDYRLRVGDYRVLYDFDLKEGKIFLLFVGHRREIYK